MKGLFIAGTNTGVGKTVITRASARAAARRGIDTAALKPVESGVNGESVTDRARIAKAALCAEDEACGLYALRAPVSPHLAARLEGTTIEPSRILHFLSKWQERAALVIAEGAGGFLVPLGPNTLYGDLIAMSGFALLVVAPNVLGTINSTLLTLESARRRGVEIAGVVFNGTATEELDNAAAVARFGGVPVLGEFPTLDTDDDDDRLADAAESALNLDALLDFLKRGGRP